MSTDKNHKEPAHNEPTTGASDHHAHGDAAHPEKDAHKDAHAQAAEPAKPASLTQAHEEELEGIKMLALDSAELATRSANLATHAGEHMRSVIVKLEDAQKKAAQAHTHYFWRRWRFDAHCKHGFCGHVHQPQIKNQST